MKRFLTFNYTRLLTIFYRRASEYVLISFDYKMISHCYLLYRLTAVASVLQPIAGRLSTLGSVHEQVKWNLTPSNEREKIVTAYESENTSIRKLSPRFDVSKAFVQRLLKQKKIKGHLQPGKQGGTIPSELDGYSAQLAQMVDKYPDATQSEYCEYWG